MNNLYRKAIAFLAKHVGRYYFVEIEETPNVPDRPTQHRIIVRALTTASAIQAGYNLCRVKKTEDGKEYALSAIHKI